MSPRVLAEKKKNCLYSVGPRHSQTWCTQPRGHAGEHTLPPDTQESTPGPRRTS